MPLHALADLSNATAASQAEMEAGTETALRVMSPLRVSQAIAALGGGGSGGTWGSITGTLSAQTDLQTVLDGKVSSDPTGVTGADAITNIISLTQAEYDAIGSPSATTYYIITDAAAGTLAQFDATTSAQLAGVISDETGTGALVFANSPTLVTPALGTPSALTLTNATGLPVGGITATGTPSGTTYLRGDGAWATPAGGGSFDPASPGAIGGTTPAAGTFTNLTSSGVLAMPGGVNVEGGFSGSVYSYRMWTNGTDWKFSQLGVIGFTSFDNPTGQAFTAGISRFADGALGVGTTAGGVDSRITWSPPASVTPSVNGQMEFELTSNTSLTIKVKGSDGTVRSIALTLA